MRNAPDADSSQTEAAAPPPVDAESFLKRVRASDLLDAARLAEVSALPAAKLTDARVLAREILQRGWLTPFQVNQLFQGRGEQLLVESYVLLERLGEGGMGQVFKARHRKLGHLVALKLIRKDRLLNPDVIRRFKREIQATSQLSHPHIVRALDAGDVGIAHYFAMEFIDGVDLSKLVRRGGMLPPDKACEYIRQAALALHYAHLNGIVHRDVKPSNLLLRVNTGEPIVMVLDLGLARRLDREGADLSTTLTDEGAVMGTPDYIAPEQAEESHNVDARADIYSLGCTLYYLLNARPPFSGSSLAAKLRQHLFVEPTPIEQLRSDLPPGLAFVIRKMMAKRPEERYQTAAEVAEALAAVFRDVPTAVAIVETPAAPQAIPLDPLITIPSEERTFSLPTTTRWQRKSSWMLLGLGTTATGLLSVLLLIAVAGFFLFPPKPPPVITQPSPPPPKEWEVALDKLRQRADNPEENRAALFEDVLKFQQKYPREPNALLGGAGLLHRLPSPLDKLDPAAIPEEERYPWQPPEQVAIVGTQRFRHWTPTRALVWDDLSAAPISAAGDCLYFWDANGRLLRMEKQEARLDGLAISSGKEAILAGLGHNGNIRLWKRRNKGFEVWYNTGPGFSSRVALTPQGTLLAAGAGASVSLWDLTGSMPKRVSLDGGTVSTKPVDNIALRADGKWLAASDREGRIKLWNWQDGGWKTALEIPSEYFTKDPEAGVRSFAFQPEGDLFVACTNGGGYVFRWDLSKQVPQPGKEFAPRNGGGSVAFTADGKTLAVVWGAEANACFDFWTNLDAREPKLDRYWSANPGEQPEIVFSTDQKTQSTAFFSRRYRYNNVALELGDHSNLGWKERLLPGLASPVGGLVFAADGRTLLTGGGGQADQRLLRWHLTDNQFSLAGPSTVGWRGLAGLSLTSNRDNQLLLGYGDQLLWSKWTGTDLGEVAVSPTIGGVLDASVALTQPRLVTLRRSNLTVNLFNLNEPLDRIPVSFPTHDADLTCVALSPNGQTLVIGCRSGPVHFWQFDNKKWTERVAFKQPLNRLLFHPDGTTLFGGSCDGMIHVWNVESEPITERYPLSGHNTEVTRLALAPDGTTLASADTENTLIVWDLSGRKKLLSHRWPGAVTSLAFAPDSRHLAVGMSNGVTYILRVHPSPK